MANLKVANSYKQSFVKAYAYFAIINNIEWKRPRYRSERKLALAKLIFGTVLFDIHKGDKFEEQTFWFLEKPVNVT